MKIKEIKNIKDLIATNTKRNRKFTIITKT